MTQEAQDNSNPPNSNMSEPELPLGDSGVPPVGGGEGSELSALMAAAGRQRGGALERPPKSLPVLAAFQEFLEAERRRARNRTIILSAFFGLILIAVITIGTLTAMLAFSRLERDNERLEGNLAMLQEKTQNRELELQSAFARLEGKTESELKSLLEKQREADSAPTPVPIAPVQPPRDDKAIKEVSKTVAQLRNDNVRLRQELGTIKSGMPRLTQQVDNLLEEIQELRSRPTEPVVVAPPVDAYNPPPRRRQPMIPSVKRVQMEITPSGSDQRISWRVPIPE